MFNKYFILKKNLLKYFLFESILFIRFFSSVEIVNSVRVLSLSSSFNLLKFRIRIFNFLSSLLCSPPPPISLSLTLSMRSLSQSHYDLFASLSLILSVLSPLSLSFTLSMLSPSLFLSVSLCSLRLSLSHPQYLLPLSQNFKS